MSSKNQGNRINYQIVRNFAALATPCAINQALLNLPMPIVTPAT